jgi:flagellar protein FlaF
MQTISGREIEASVLEQAAMKLRRSQHVIKEGRFNQELDEAIQFNNKVWKILQADWQDPESQLPRELRENLLSLSVFIRKSSLSVMADPTSEKIDVLIQINDNLVKGLRSGKRSGSGSPQLEEALHFSA